MAYSQYSRPKVANEPPEDDQTGGSSASFSNWRTLINNTAPRKRNMGRVRTTAMPQRMSTLKSHGSDSPERSHPMPQRLGLSPARTISTSSDSSGEPSDRHMLPMPQRSNPIIKSTPEKPFPMPQRMSRNTPEKSYPMPQRLNTPDKNSMPQRMMNSSMKTPEMPQLKTLNLSPTTARKKTPSARSPSVVRMRAKRSPSPKSRSRSTPPVRSQRPQTNPVISAVRQPTMPVIPPPEPKMPQKPAAPAEPSRPTLVVNGNYYYVMDRIGKGGSSEVFQVLEAKGSNMLAIKKVDLSDVSDQEANAFRQEIELLLRLQGNKRIVKLIDFEERTKADGMGKELLVVMEKGSRDLANLLKELSASEENGLSDATIKFYWEGMLKSVSVVHKMNIVHSDLKPANFLIVDGMLKLIDFGIASSVQDDKTHVTKENQMGTLNYISPETLNSSGNIKIGFKSDVWSLGCILYNLVYKKLPFSHIKVPIAKMQAIIDPSHKIDFPRDQNSLRGHDSRVVDVLQRCLVRDVNHRASIEELLNHSYLKSAEPIKETKKHLAVDLSSYEQLTPRTFKRVIMENLSNSNVNSKNMAPPPAYSQDS